MTDGEQLSWFLVNNIDLLVRLCDEEPVSEFLSSLHRNSSASGLVIQAITTKCLPIAEVGIDYAFLITFNFSFVASSCLCKTLQLVDIR